MSGRFETGRRFEMGRRFEIGSGFEICCFGFRFFSLVV